MIEYPWAVNLSKLKRAEAMCPGQDEAAIKEAYIKLGGRIEETPSKDQPNLSEDVNTPVVDLKEKKSKPSKKSVDPQ